MTPSPYWSAFVDALPDSGTVTVVNGDLRRLVEQLNALGEENQRLRRRIDAQATEIRRLERIAFRADL